MERKDNGIEHTSLHCKIHPCLFVFIPFRLKGCSGYTQKTFACRVSYPFINLSKQIMCKSSRYQCNLIMHSFLNICFESGVTSSIVLITGPIYFWQQTEEDVTVNVRLPEGTTKDDIRFKLTVDCLRVGVGDHAPLLDGQLFAPVDPEASTWIIKDAKR